MKLKVSPDFTSVSVGGFEFAVEDGIANVGNLPDELVQRLRSAVGAEVATEIEATAAAEKGADARGEKASVMQALKDLGVPFDGRKSLAVLQAQLAAAEAAKTPEPSAVTEASA